MLPTPSTPGDDLSSQTHTRAQRRTTDPAEAPAGSRSGSSVLRGPALRRRAEWMDVVRGTAILLIVGFHGVQFLRSYGDLTEPAWAAAFNTAMTPLRIPLLMLLSGMLLGGSFAKGPRRYVTGKLRNVGWPYLVWALLWGAMSWPVYSLVGFALGGSYLWFMLYLFVFYLLAWPLRRLPPELVVAVAVVVTVVASVTSGSQDADPFTLERWSYLFAVFMAGHVLTSRSRVRDWLFSSPGALAVAVGLLALHRALDLGFDYGMESSPLMVAGAIIVIRLARLTAGAAVLRPLRFVGRNSIVFYLVHYPVMVAVASAAAVVGVSSEGVLLAVMLAVAIATSTALALVRHRAAVSWLFEAPFGRRSRRGAPATGPGGRASSAAVRVSRP